MKNFIIATGRCGSTLLSRCMALHPETLVLLEFWPALDHHRRFQEGDVTGEELVGILSADVSLAHLWLSRGFKTLEVHGEIEASDIFTPRFRVPGLLIGALAFLSPEPREVYEELLAWAAEQPTRPLDQHYADLFDWLTKRFDKTYCIERSAGSTEHVAEVLRCFPEARFVHIHRDGPEAALSMYNHTYFDFAVSMLHDPPSREELEVMVECTAPPTYDPIIRRVKRRPPVEAFGKFWATSIARLYHDIQQIPPERYVDVWFEDLVADPPGVLDGIREFFELPPNDQWLAEASALVTPVPSRVDELSDEERQRLEEACHVGQVLLGRDPNSARTPILGVEATIRELYDQPSRGAS